MILAIAVATASIAAFLIGLAVASVAAIRKLNAADAAILRLTSQLRARNVPEFVIDEAIYGEVA